MKMRCENPNHVAYAAYGGRGIAVCERWQFFENFYADMGHRPTPSHTIERIDNDKGYEKSNCRWATHKEQAANRRNNTWLIVRGEKMIKAHAIRKYSVVSETAAHARIDKGWPIENALFDPYGSKHPKRRKSDKCKT